MKFSKRATSAAVWLALMGTGLGAAASDGEHRQHGAHEHGRGTLQVATEGTDLVVTLRVPAANVVGFEHAPGDDAQRLAVERALATFRRPADVLVPSREARCRVTAQAVELEGFDGDAEESTHGGHGPAGIAAPAHGGDHDTRPASAGVGHAELHATYRYHCEAPQALRTLVVRAFEHLRDAGVIEAQVVTSSVQRAVELRPGAASLRLVR